MTTKRHELDEWTQDALHELSKSLGRDERRTLELNRYLSVMKQLRGWITWAERSAPEELRRVPLESGAAVLISPCRCGAGTVRREWQ